MNRRLAPVALAAAALIGGVLASAGAASASNPPPQISTTYLSATIYPCTNGTCAIGPGNVGMPTGAALFGTGGPQYLGPESNAYLMKIVAGALPPGLQLGLPDAEWMITGTPTTSGTYTFTVQIASQAGGPDGTQRFTITIGNGSSDNLVTAGAGYNAEKRSLQVGAFDTNLSATYTVFSNATGVELGTLHDDNSGDGQTYTGDGGMLDTLGSSTNPGSMTIKDSLGGSVTIPVTLVKPRY